MNENLMEGKYMIILTIDRLQKFEGFQKSKFLKILLE